VEINYVIIWQIYKCSYDHEYLAMAVLNYIMLAILWFS